MKFKLLIVLLIFSFLKFSSLAQDNKAPLSIQASFFSENFLEGGSSVGFLYNNGVHIGLEYPFLIWKTYPKNKEGRFGQQESFLRFNSMFYQLPSTSNNMILNGELGLRKTFYFGLTLETGVSLGAMNYNYLYPVFTIDENNDVYELADYNYWEEFVAFSVGFGWDFEKNTSLPISLYIRTIAYERGGYISYFKNSSVIGLNFKFNKISVPAFTINNK